MATEQLLPGCSHPTLWALWGGLCCDAPQTEPQQDELRRSSTRLSTSRTPTSPPPFQANPMVRSRKLGRSQPRKGFAFPQPHAGSWGQLLARACLQHSKRCSGPTSKKQRQIRLGMVGGIPPGERIFPPPPFLPSVLHTLQESAAAPSVL